jgi:hypothetical protein
MGIINSHPVFAREIGAFSGLRGAIEGWRDGPGHRSLTPITHEIKPNKAEPKTGEIGGAFIGSGRNEGRASKFRFAEEVSL